MRKVYRDHERTEGKTRPGLSARNFRQIARYGFGDPANCYPHSMLWFNNYVYVGTTRHNLTGMKISKKKDNIHFQGNYIWPVRPIEDFRELDMRAQIWRYHPPSDVWEKVFTAPMAKATDGTDVPISIGFRKMIEFKGRSDSTTALYTFTWTTSLRPDVELIRSDNGTDFEIISCPGLGHSDQVMRVIRSLVPFKERLFAAPSMGKKTRAGGLVADKMIIIATSDPAGGQWHFACEPGFGDLNNSTVVSMCVFNDYLYAGTLNFREGYQVWKTDAEGNPPYKWIRVISHGGYRGKLNEMAMTMYPFDGALYVGSAINTGGYDRENCIGPAAPELIRIYPDDTWDLVVGEPRYTPDGFKIPLSGLGSGFMNPFACYIWSMSDYEGWLYLGNSVISPFLPFIDFEKSPQTMRRSINLNSFNEYIKRFSGSDLWRSRDGIQWIPITRNGFGNPYNIGIRNMISSPHGLFVGFANLFGPEVAVKRIAGWKYEPNPKSGLEVWLGTHNADGRHSFDECAEGIKISHKTDSAVQSTTTEKSSDEYNRELLDAFYDYGALRCMGFWRKGIRNIKTACENLLEEVSAFLPDKTTNILYVGCTPGPIQHLLKHFSPGLVTGVAADKADVVECRNNIPGVQFLFTKLPSLRFPAKSFDNAMFIEGPCRFGLRDKLLRNIFSVLKPGGHFICADIIFDTSKQNVIQAYKNKTAITDPTAYHNFMIDIGFRNVKVVDVTKECWTGFQNYASGYFNMQILAGKLDTESVQKLKTLLRLDQAIGHYVLVYAQR